MATTTLQKTVQGYQRRPTMMCVWGGAQVRHVKTGSFTADLAVNNIRPEMCRWITRLVRDLYIRTPVC